MKKKIIFSNCIFLLSLLACTNELKEETSSLNLSSTYKCNFLGADNKQ